MIPTDKITYTIETMSKYNDLPKKCKLAIMNVNDIDDSWKKTRDYIGNFNTIKSYCSKQKLLNSMKDLFELKVNVPPYIYLNNDGNIDFCNGRNRFANLRDSGVKNMPFVIETKDYKKFIKRLNCKKSNF
jgi:hypothetical protein